MRRQTNGRRRRAGLRGGHLLLFFLICVGFVALASGSSARFGLFHQLTLEALGPLQGAFTTLSQESVRLKDRYITLWNLQGENDQLRKDLERYQVRLGEYREAYFRNRFLETALDFKEKEEFPALTARVVGKDPSFWFQTLIVDRGENDGVAVGMVARNSRGVVGQVVQASDNYSKILLANAPSSAIDAIVQKNRVRGILKGGGKKGYVLQYVLKNSDIQVGDVIVTAGIGGLFPQGITLGHVSKVFSQRRGMFLEIEVTPTVDFSRLEFLFINLSENQLPGEGMEGSLSHSGGE